VPSDAGAEHGGGPHRSRTHLLSGAAAVVAAAVVLLLLLTGERGPGGRKSGSATTASPYPQILEPGCKGTECDGAKAYDMGCGLPAPETLFTRRASGGQRLELRYAPECAAVWVRGTNLRLGDRVRLSLPGTETKEARAASQRDTEEYLSTAMTVTKAPRTARICLLPGDGGPEECFTPSPSPSLSASGG
ncbi:DUF2690 domain-containing protein, partial [Streptomyces sp. NPDC049577]|uniref:DUF2690 domain-containing protein n=1 Tax=Streptomyces sp. NPDC049577 TaxID=3155153 RepID=UPI003424A1E1